MKLPWGDWVSPSAVTAVIIVENEKGPAVRVETQNEDWLFHRVASREDAEAMRDEVAALVNGGLAWGVYCGQGKIIGTDLTPYRPDGTAVK